MLLSEDTHVVIIHAGVTGRKSTTTVLSTNVDPETGKERKSTKTDTVVENRAKYDEATSLVNRLRRLASEHCTFSPIGQLTDSVRLAKLEEERAQIEAEINAWNDAEDQVHFIEHDVIVMPIGRILDEKTQAKLIDAVHKALVEGRTLLEKGDVKGLGSFLNNRKNLAALMPPIVGRVVQSALDALTDARKRVMVLVRELEKDPVEAAAEVIGAGLLADVETALTWVEPAPPPAPNAETNEAH